jgi:8-oxo-dGTP diphosphatase
MSPPAFAVAADVACFRVRDAVLEVLLVRRRHPPFAGALALPGGFVEIDETLAQAAARELREETGLVSDVPLLQCGAYGDPGRDPRGPNVSVLHLGVVVDGDGAVAGDDAAGVLWHAVAELDTDGVLAFDHVVLLRDAALSLAERIEHTVLAAAFCRPPFTLAQLREVYEAVWEVHCDPTNFRRKVTAIPGFVVASGTPRRGEGAAASLGRPAQYYEAGTATLLDPPFHRPRRR